MQPVTYALTIAIAAALLASSLCSHPRVGDAAQRRSLALVLGLSAGLGLVVGGAQWLEGQLELVLRSALKL
ncbi:MAG: hypothetical protein KF718_29035 [Polyangiaceae bacterium]|nr:hypothetical protein [Polyangiaceae bacterium]